LAGERDWLLARLEAVPDLTLRGLVAELRARRDDELRRGLADRARRRHQLQEKTLFATEQDRPAVARRRALEGPSG
jgi:hypothetical protein